MPITLDPDAAAVYKAFQEAGRPAYETLTAPEAREYYLNARFVSNPEPPRLEAVDTLSIPAAPDAPPRFEPSPPLRSPLPTARSRPASTRRRRCARRMVSRHVSCCSMAAAR